MVLSIALGCQQHVNIAKRHIYLRLWPADGTAGSKDIAQCVEGPGQHACSQALPPFLHSFCAVQGNVLSLLLLHVLHCQS